MQVTESIILLIYLIAMTLFGVYFYSRARQSENDYFTAGQSINTFVGAFAIFAAVASSSSLMGAVGSGVAMGVPYFLRMLLVSLPFFHFLCFWFPDRFAGQV